MRALVAEASEVVNLCEELREAAQKLLLAMYASGRTDAALLSALDARAEDGRHHRRLRGNPTETYGSLVVVMPHAGSMFSAIRATTRLTAIGSSSPVLLKATSPRAVL